MVSRWGMSEKIGPINLRQSEEHPFLGREIAQPRHFSEEMSNKVDQAVLKLLQDAELAAMKIITDHKKVIENLIDTLEAEETIDAKAIVAILKSKTHNNVTDIKKSTKKK